jgi:2-methylisocitrate lyase-like PEP mutase family enzyme
MAQSVSEKRAVFRALHEDGCFVIPNPWDVGSARMLQHLGFKALATTSAGFAWSNGHPDYAVSRDDVLNHLATVAQSVDVPLNADFESGFAVEPEGVAESVALAIKTGVAGLSIEDRKLGDTAALFDIKFAAERVKAARAAIAASGQDVVLVARTEILLSDPKAVGQAADKLAALAAAGADCLFAPGVKEPSDIAVLVKAVSPKPLNVVMMGPGLSFAQLADLGVRRISVGGALARVTWAAMISTAEKIAAGNFDGLVDGTSGKALNEIFRTFS